ncbi:hypothetical protein ACJA3G_36250, partial [Streptomyces sp. YS-3]
MTANAPLPSATVQRAVRPQSSAPSTGRADQPRNSRIRAADGPQEPNRPSTPASSTDATRLTSA